MGNQVQSNGLESGGTGMAGTSIEDAFRRLEVMLAGGAVKRCHTLPVLRVQTVAEHTFRAQCIALELCRLNGIVSGVEEVLTALLVHDVPEVATGDAPAYVKHDNDSIAAAYARLELNFNREYRIETPLLQPLELDIVHAADGLELLLYLVDERRAGNRHSKISECFEVELGYLEPLASRLPGLTELIDRVCSAWARGRYDE